jgi:hypothetical protein
MNITDIITKKNVKTVMTLIYKGIDKVVDILDEAIEKVDDKIIEATCTEQDMYKYTLIFYFKTGMSIEHTVRLTPKQVEDIRYMIASKNDNIIKFENAEGIKVTMSVDDIIEMRVKGEQYGVDSICINSLYVV